MSDGAELARLRKAIKQAFDREGCGCIKDLPGDNYTCSAHAMLRKVASTDAPENEEEWARHTNEEFGAQPYKFRAEDYQRFSPFLFKASYDPFDYALGLADGTILRFRRLSIVATNWIYIAKEDFIPDEQYSRTKTWELPWTKTWELPFRFDRGIEININQILWIADAPDGS